MGAGASAGIAAGVGAAKADDLKCMCAALDPASRAKLLAALGDGKEGAAKADSKPECKSDAKPVLTYFPIASRGETARMLCKVGGLEIVDNACMGDESIKPIDYFSPKSLPLLKHGDLQMAQSLPIEAYLSRVAPKYAKLTAQQRALDGVICAVKEDVNAGCAAKLFEPCKDGAAVKEFLDKWWKVVEGKCPEKGFFNGLDFPTAADLACVTMCEGYMPFGALMKQAEVPDHYKTYPKLAALVKRTMEYSDVAEYLKTNKSLKQAAFDK